jgi:hypothetical protein
MVAQSKTLLSHILLNRRSVFTLHLFPVSTILGFSYTSYDEHKRESYLSYTKVKQSHYRPGQTQTVPGG